ncbi:TetR/AcrR family transcriptional regulator [Enterovirga sp.]|uniref:TetR/AcrR family transcriptional regulator n=1 Tax=Enterovirga sp. TaxID=2026350 RepID=UPI002BCFB998|nr:TetR/AcrR family transcriptional regulator [Enterovirga sp.]HMO28324.1 TetR/AcrR family transcriptional regulator [Enterovirga sp.]
MLQATSDTPDRRTRILDAAERCFVRQGFHLTTMQHIAAEAGMSAGNLYRYFPSKDSLVEGLCERDRREMAHAFEAFEGAEDFMAVFAQLGRHHFEDEPREKAILCLQIWAEATRSPAVAGIVSALSDDVVERLAAILERARARGAIAPVLPPVRIARLIATLADGLFVRRALAPGFDAAAEIPPVLDLIGGLVSGRVAGDGCDCPNAEVVP